MKRFIVKNKSAGNKKAFEIIKAQVLKKPSSLLGLAVGKTTDGIYKLISKDVVKSPKIWKKVKLFQIDENLGISSDSKASFNFEIRRELKKLLKIINPKNIFLMNGLESPKKIIKDAYKFIRKNKGIDLIVLGIGPDYDPHIAYNTTGKSSLNSKMRAVDLHPKIAAKIKVVRARRGVPQQGITLGIKDILQTKKVLLIAYEKEKAKSLKLAFAGKVDTKRASASALQMHKDLNVIIDVNASRFLSRKLSSKNS